MKRDDAINTIRSVLDGRQLIWFGTRGDDIEAISNLPELTAAFSIINAYNERESVDGLAYESLLGRRVDLDTFDIDDELGAEPMVSFRKALLRTMARPSVAFTYRPSTLLSAVCFARRDRCRYAGMFKDHQNAFEHKPWVETAMRDLGLPGIPWEYIADDDQLDSLRLLDEGAVVLRTSRSSGGTGLTRVETRDELHDAWPRQVEAYVSVAPFIEGGLPVNVGAVVWNDGITVHPASVQLIGIEGFTTRPFGYCGNDFAAFERLEPEVIDLIDRSTRRIGMWLGGHGYRGAFGVDYLVVDGCPLFTEVNPRFQGSSHASSRLSVESDLPCILLDHLAASLDLPSWGDVPLVVRRDTVEALSHVVIHSVLPEPAKFDLSGVRRHVSMSSTGLGVDVELPDDMPSDPGAALARVSIREAVTDDGFGIAKQWASIPSALRVKE